MIGEFRGTFFCLIKHVKTSRENRPERLPEGTPGRNGTESGG